MLMIYRLTFCSDGEEVPRAYIVKSTGRDVTADAIMRFMEQKVSRDKRLAGGVRFVDSIMKNPVSSKIYPSPRMFPSSLMPANLG